MTTKNIFASKQDYLAFRAAFAAAQNDLRAKKGKPDSNGYKQPGWLRPAHYMLLNLARGLPHDRGFTAITCQRKLDNGCQNPDGARDAAEQTLTGMINCAVAYLNPKPVEKSWRYAKMTQEQANAAHQADLLKNLRAFLEPIEDAFSINDLANLKFVS